MPYKKTIYGRSSFLSATAQGASQETWTLLLSRPGWEARFQFHREWSFLTVDFILNHNCLLLLFEISHEIVVVTLLLLLFILETPDTR